MADRRKGIHAEVKCTRMAESYRKPGSVSGLHGSVLANVWHYGRSNIDPDPMRLRRRRSRGGGANRFAKITDPTMRAFIARLLRQFSRPLPA